MFAIGHFALGYLTGKGASKLLGVKLNMPLIFLASIIPDIDLLLQYLEPTLFMHRGPTHSIITFTVIMIPFFVRYRKQAIPYFIALVSHSFLGDLFTGGFEMLWPISQQWFGLPDISVMSIANIITEMLLFAVAVTVMLKVDDLQTLLKPGNRNLFLIIPFGATLGPMLDISQSFEGSIPSPLIPMSIFWVTIFAYSMLIELCAKNKLGFLAKLLRINVPPK
jgi:membrane-bound metal-dependent hydrolase YbcI (DUF457 family)